MQTKDVSKEQLIRDLTRLRQQLTKMEQSHENERKFHDEIIRTKAMFEGLFEFSPDAIIVVSRNGSITQANKQAENVFSYSRRELAEVKVETLLPERFRKRHFEHRKKYMANPRIRPMGMGLELYGRKKDGTVFPVDISLGPITVGNEIYVIAVIRDVSEIRKERDELKARTSELAEAVKELDAFSYSVSHDLRTPLRHLSGFVEMLQNRLEGHPDEKVQHYTSIIATASGKMGILIDDLLALSRAGRTEMKKKKIDLNVIVKDIVQEISNETRGRVIKWHIDELPEVSGDQSLLRIALVNLISNAVKFTRIHPEAEIEIGCKDPEDEFICSVGDNGVGFDMKYADRLFGVFQRLHTEKEFEGTGVGLAIVRRIITRHGGRIWAESVMGQGATFYFTLPKPEELS